MQTVTKDGIKTVIDICGPIPPPDDFTISTAPQQTPISDPDSLAGCLQKVTRDGIVVTINICAITSTGDSSITAAPESSPTSLNHPRSDCQIILHHADGTSTTMDCGAFPASPITRVPSQHTSISHHQFFTACLTTLVAPDGQIVVVSCGNGFDLGHPATANTPAPTSTPATICMENRCFEAVGTFGSASTTTETAPTQTHLKDEL